MNKIRVLVADDEPLARRGVRQLLARHPDMTVVGECRNGAETLSALDTLAADLLFLDVQMPEMNGFEVIEAAGANRMPLIVFVTAYDNFAVQAFETHALDYLVKPLNVERFEAMLARVRERLKLNGDARLAAQLQALLAVERAERKKPGIERLTVSTEMGDLVLPAADIDWIEADDYYARLHAGSKTYQLRESLHSLQSRLDPESFVRTHRSFLVQLNRVREVHTKIGGGDIVLRDGSRLPVSRRNRAMLKRLLRSKDLSSPASD
jgi:two-component system LytT family response regulator